MPRGWALLLCAYLLIWSPISFGIELFATLPSLATRGSIARAELLFHGASTVMSATAGCMLLVRNPAAPLAAAVAVIVSGGASIQSLFWTMLPRQVAPGERLPLALLTGGHSLFWLLMTLVYYRRRDPEP